MTGRPVAFDDRTVCDISHLGRQASSRRQSPRDSPLRIEQVMVSQTFAIGPGFFETLAGIFKTGFQMAGHNLDSAKLPWLPSSNNGWPGQSVMNWRTEDCPALVDSLPLTLLDRSARTIPESEPAPYLAWEWQPSAPGR